MLFLRYPCKNKNFVHWTNHFTFYNRYPKVFYECSKVIKNKRNPKILSFGCSTGEECSTIRKYFPNCEIVGVEINEQVLATAKIKNPHPKTTYVNQLTTEDGFDLILCMSVFLRIARSGDGFDKHKVCPEYKFEYFEHELENLIQRLNKKGLLVIYNSHYKFEDTKFINNFTPIRKILNNTIEESGFIGKFDKEGNPVLPYKDCIFIKN